jgi:hypothetical protein
MKRLAINILDTDWARIRIEAYFALSSNSVQLGARVELYFGFDAFYVDGFLGFDALFRFSPFYFEFGIACGLTLHVFGFDLLSIHLQFALSGPSPWRALGTGSLTLLFFEIEVDFDVTWGDEANTTLPEITILPELLAKLEDVANWRALPPPSAGLWTTIRPLGPGETDLVLHPAGALSVSQRVAPLDFTWERIGHQRPADVQRASITGATSGQAELSVEPVSDQFARAQFENLTDAEKLSVPSFERMHAGATVGAGKDIGAGPGVGRTIEYEVSVIDKVPQAPGRFVLIPGLYDTFLAGGAVKRSPASLAHRRRLDPQGEKISVDDERHVVASTANNTAHGPQQGFASEAMAKQYMARQIAADPALADQLHVLPASEVNAA